MRIHMDVPLKYVLVNGAVPQALQDDIEIVVHGNQSQTDRLAGARIVNAVWRDLLDSGGQLPNSPAGWATLKSALGCIYHAANKLC
jgi:hypothetical protein